MFETIDDIIRARRSCPKPAKIVAALLKNDLSAKVELLTVALTSAIAAIALFNDKDSVESVITSLAIGKRTAAVKAVETAFTAAVREVSGIVNKSGVVTDITDTDTFVSTFNYVTGILSEQVSQAMAPKPKAPRAKKEDAPSPVENPQTPVIGVDPKSHTELLQEFNTVATKATENAEKLRALTADLAVKSAALKNAETQIELLKRQLEGQKLTNYGLKTRAKRLRGLADGYKTKAAQAAQKPTRAAQKTRSKV
jgi:predicted HAD superfamily phosphohydrolase YqeG